MTRCVFIAGASGFVGRALCAAWQEDAALHVVPGMRRPDRPGVRRFDLDDPASLAPALAGCDAAVFLVHGLARGHGYEAWEARVAQRFISACIEAHVRRVIYLGGPDPGPTGSAHLRARLRTGRLLRDLGAAASIDVVELRAAVIVGAGSDSFRLIRDIALRVPFLIDAPWLHARQAPVAIDDVVVAVRAALDAPPGCYDVPGPDSVSGLELMLLMKELAGLPRHVAPALPWRTDLRGLAGRVAGIVTRVHKDTARELVLGMGAGDLSPHGTSIWSCTPAASRVPVREALRRAFAADDPGFVAHLVEGAIAAQVRRAARARPR